MGKFRPWEGEAPAEPVLLPSLRVIQRFAAQQELRPPDADHKILPSPPQGERGRG